MGYAAWDEEGLKAAARRRTSPSDAVQLPYCEGLEVVSSAAVNTRPELLTEGPSFSSGGGRSGGEGGGSDGSSSSDGSTAQRPGRSFGMSYFILHYLFIAIYQSTILYSTTHTQYQALLAVDNRSFQRRLLNGNNSNRDSIEWL